MFWRATRNSNLTPRLSLVASMTSIMFRNFSLPVSPCPNVSEFCIDIDAIADTALQHARKRAHPTTMLVYSSDTHITVASASL